MAKTLENLRLILGEMSKQTVLLEEIAGPIRKHNYENSRCLNTLDEVAKLREIRFTFEDNVASAREASAGAGVILAHENELRVFIIDSTILLSNRETCPRVSYVEEFSKPRGQRVKCSFHM